MVAYKKIAIVLKLHRLEIAIHKKSKPCVKLKIVILIINLNKRDTKNINSMVNPRVNFTELLNRPYGHKRESPSLTLVTPVYLYFIRPPRDQTVI